jgi:deazaflavin-dependent oxidoreductase (nitroreductase family)
MISPAKKLRLKIEAPIIVFAYRILARWLGQYPFLLLTTTGRKTQRQRTLPLVYMPVEDSFLVIAANVGLDAHPGWFLNLKHRSQAQVQIGSRKMIVTAEEVPAAERDQLWSKWIEINPGYQMFQARTTRVFSMVILKPV